MSASEGDNPMEPTEIIDVDGETVACEGGGASGHPRVFLHMDGQGQIDCPPRVFLHMDGQGQIDCPYCGCRFVLKSGAQEAAAGPSP
jgi:uncharacterized Zn-finger protein